MTRTLKIFFAALAAIVLTAASSVAADSMIPDRIVAKSSQQIANIKITAIDVSGVTYSKFQGSGGASKISAEDIAEISFGDMPGEMRRAVADMKAGNNENALKSIDRLPASGPREFWYAPYKILLRAQCLVALGRNEEAVPVLTELISRHSRSYYVIEGIQTKAHAHTALKQWDAVADTCTALDPDNGYADPAATSPYGKMWQLRGQQQKAGAFTNIDGRLDEAAKIYENIAKVAETLAADTPDSLKNSADELRAIYQSALIGRADVLLKEGKTADAAQWMNSVSEKITDRSVRMQMYLTLGEILSNEARKESDTTASKTKFKESMLAYMRVYILFPDQKQQRAKAMLGAAIASNMIGTPADNSRAGKIAKELVTEYPNTDEAKEAARLLESLGIRVGG